MVRAAKSPPSVAAVLRTSIGVGQGAAGLSSTYGHDDGVKDDFAVNRRTGGPANYFSREQIHYHRQIEPAFPSPYIGNIRDPGLVRARPVKLLLSVQYYLGVSRRFSGISGRISGKYWTLPRCVFPFLQELNAFWHVD